MSDFVTLLLENLPEVFSLVIGLVSFLLVWYKTKSFNIAINSYKEVLEDMKYKSPQNVGKYSQDYTGSNLKTQYHYNESTGELEELPTKVDIQAQIDSALETCLDKVLEKFLPPTGATIDEVGIARANVSKLDEMLALTEKAEEYRKAFNLSSDLSMQEIYLEVQKKADVMKAQLSNFANNNSEVTTDEKKND